MTHLEFESFINETMNVEAVSLLCGERSNEKREERKREKEMTAVIGLRINSLLSIPAAEWGNRPPFHIPSSSLTVARILTDSWIFCSGLRDIYSNRSASVFGCCFAINFTIGSVSGSEALHNMMNMTDPFPSSLRCLPQIPKNSIYFMIRSIVSHCSFR